MKTQAFIFYGALFVIVLNLFTGCTRYSNQVQTEGGGTLKTSVVAFGSKVDLSGVESDKELGPNGLVQSTKADAVSGEAQFRELAAVFLAGSQISSSVTGRGQSVDPELLRALVDRIPEQKDNRNEAPPIVSDDTESPGGADAGE